MNFECLTSGGPQHLPALKATNRAKHTLVSPKIHPQPLLTDTFSYEKHLPEHLCLSRQPPQHWQLPPSQHVTSSRNSKVLGKFRAGL